MVTKQTIRSLTRTSNLLIFIVYTRQSDAVQKLAPCASAEDYDEF